jgi:RNA polymerase sigma factor (sigma-70 family)
VLAREEYLGVVKAVRGLPRRQQQVLVLRYWAEMADTDIAEALGVKETTIRSSASRALGTVAKYLEVNP